MLLGYKPIRLILPVYLFTFRMYGVLSFSSFYELLEICILYWITKMMKVLASIIME